MAVRKNVTIDWRLRENVQAQMRVLVRPNSGPPISHTPYRFLAACYAQETIARRGRAGREASFDGRGRRTAREPLAKTRAPGIAPVRPAAGDGRLDRLLHHSTVASIQGESYRLKDKRRAGLLKARQPRAPQLHRYEKACPGGSTVTPHAPLDYLDKRRSKRAWVRIQPALTADQLAA